MQYSVLLLIVVAAFAKAVEFAPHRRLDDPPIPPNAVIVRRINCGSKTGFTDADGNIWIKDTFFEGGGRFYTPFVGIRGTVNDELYRSSRYEFKVRASIDKARKIQVLHLVTAR
jgi:hypothetical protein